MREFLKDKRVRIALIVAGVIALLLCCCGAVTACSPSGSGAGGNGFEIDFNHKKKSSKKKSMGTYNKVLAGYFHTRNCISCHG